MDRAYEVECTHTKGYGLAFETTSNPNKIDEPKKFSVWLYPNGDDIVLKEAQFERLALAMLVEITRIRTAENRLVEGSVKVYECSYCEEFTHCLMDDDTAPCCLTCFRAKKWNTGPGESIAESRAKNWNTGSKDDATS
jgi:hypothetical protein